MPAEERMIAFREGPNTVKGQTRRAAPHRHVAMKNAHATRTITALGAAE